MKLKINFSISLKITFMVIIVSFISICSIAIINLPSIIKRIKSKKTSK